MFEAKRQQKQCLIMAYLTFDSFVSKLK